MSPSEGEAGPSKRRRMDKSPPRPRYFAGPADLGEIKARQTNPTKRKRFSPSAPVVELDSDDQDSSGESGSSSQGDEDAVDATKDVDEGRVRWSVPATPTAAAGQSRSRHTEEEVSTASTSTFAPLNGVNLHVVSEEELRNAGLGAETEGGGVVISLGKGDSHAVRGLHSRPSSKSHIRLLLHTSPVFRHFFTISSSLRPDFTSTPRPHLFLITVGGHFTLLDRIRLPSSFLLQESKTGKPRTIFLLREYRSGIEELRGSVVPGFGNIWLGETGPWGLRGIHPVIGSFPAPVYPYIHLPSWTSALSSLPHLYPLKPTATPPPDPDDPLAPCVVLITGPKRSGKSSIGRAAVNRLLEVYERVAWLECDLGQGEFGCGGVAGVWVVERPVFGPPFTHPRVPNRAHYLGALTPQSCPEEYLTAIRHLISFYRYELQHPTPTPRPSLNSKNGSVVPLVVNTQGWVKGLGEDLLRAIEGMVEPTHVFGFESQMDGEGDEWPDESRGMDQQSPLAG